MENNSVKRIKRSSDFESLKYSGAKISVCSWMFVTYKKTATSDFQFGITVSRKVGSAVTRNKLKRYCREYFENSDFAPPGGIQINVIFRSMNDGFYKSLLFADFKKSLSRTLQNLR